MSTVQFAYAYAYAVVIGRFAPVVAGDQALIDQALRIAERVIVVVGSVRTPRSVKNPFTFEEREGMVRAGLGGDAQSRVSVVGVADSPYNDQLWIASTQSAVDQRIRLDGGQPAQAKVALVGRLRDASSEHLKLFPCWSFVAGPAAPAVEGVQAAGVRELYFDPGRADSLQRAGLPDATAAFLERFASTEAYAALCEERAFLIDYQAKYRYAGSDFPPIYTTVDAVVVQAGHILLVQRKFHPGKGSWALPGGFVGPHERLQQAAIRELEEETRLALPLSVLQGSLKASHVFDAPERSQRGRTITHGFFFELLQPAAAGLSEVRAEDDAAAVRWVPIAEFLAMQEQVYEDHYFIANHFLGALGRN